MGAPVGATDAGMVMGLKPSVTYCSRCTTCAESLQSYGLQPSTPLPLTVTAMLPLPWPCFRDQKMHEAERQGEKTPHASEYGQHEIPQQHAGCDVQDARWNQQPSG